jgi:hypothetical protein
LKFGLVETKGDLVASNWSKALEQTPKQAGWVLLQIGHLYSIKRKLRRWGAGAVLRQADRAQSEPDDLCAARLWPLQVDDLIDLASVTADRNFSLEEWEL